MIVTAKLENPDQTDVTLTITMPLAGWRVIRAALNSNDHAYKYDNQDFRAAIDHVITGLEARIDDKSLTREVES